MTVLKLTLEMSGRKSKVELNGIDISGLLCGVAVSTDVGGVTTTTLHYRGAIVAEVAGGGLTLVQAPIYVQCDKCYAIVSGAPAEPRAARLDAFQPDPPAEQD